MNYLDILESTHFFAGIKRGNIEAILSCLQADVRQFKKGQTILYEGDIIQSIGILITGTAHSLKTGLDGKQVIITLLNSGSYIGVLLAASRERRSSVSVRAVKDTSILFIPISNLLARGDCPQHAVLLSNFIDGIAEKALMLHERNDCLIMPTIREKVLTYLKKTANSVSGLDFTIPFNRGEMADYLNVERSALSRELSNMKRDGLINYHKNRFELLS